MIVSSWFRSPTRANVNGRRARRLATMEGPAKWPLMPVTFCWPFEAHPPAWRVFLLSNKATKKTNPTVSRMQRRSEEMPTDLWTSLLLLWITLLPCVSMMPVGGAETAAGPGEGQRLLSRAKRGWVWNQMFVLEEFSGPDPILVGRVSGGFCRRLY